MPQIRRNNNNKPQPVSEISKARKKQSMAHPLRDLQPAIAGSAWRSTEFTTQRKEAAEKHFCTLPGSRLLWKVLFFRKLLRAQSHLQVSWQGSLYDTDLLNILVPMARLAACSFLPIFSHQGLPESKTVCYHLQPPRSDLPQTAH